MADDQFPSNVHWAAQTFVRWSPKTVEKLVTPAWEWVASVATIVLLAAIFTPKLVLCARDPIKTVRIPDYSTLAGLVGAAALIVALGLRAYEYKIMTHWRQAVYILQWSSYGIMVVASIVVLSIKYGYAMPAVRRRCQASGDCEPLRNAVGFLA